jgi:uncharacterized protein YqeY
MAAIKDRLRNDLTEAIRARDEVQTGTLRMALAAITKAEVAGSEQVELSDDQVVDVLRSEVKKRNDAAELYDQGKRPELAEKERSEAGILTGYLPAELDDVALEAIVAEEVAAVTADGASGGQAMGRVIKAVQARVGKQAAGARIAAATKSALGLG